jgi:hypothetical protein
MSVIRIRIAALVALYFVSPWTAEAFVPLHPSVARSSSTLSMVLEKPKIKEIAKIEQLKVDSKYLLHPLDEVRLDSCYIILLCEPSNTLRSDEYDSFPV